jgi:hypothetical protein
VSTSSYSKTVTFDNQTAQDAELTTVVLTPWELDFLATTLYYEIEEREADEYTEAFDALLQKLTK